MGATTKGTRTRPGSAYDVAKAYELRGREIDRLRSELDAERALSDRLAAALRAEMGDGRGTRPAQWYVESYRACHAHGVTRGGVAVPGE